MNRPRCPRCGYYGKFHAHWCKYATSDPPVVPQPAEVPSVPLAPVTPAALAEAAPAPQPAPQPPSPAIAVGDRVQLSAAGIVHLMPRESPTARSKFWRGVEGTAGKTITRGSDQLVIVRWDGMSESHRYHRSFIERIPPAATPTAAPPEVQPSPADDLMATWPQRTRPAEAPLRPAPTAPDQLIQAEDVAGTIHAVRQNEALQGWPMALCGWIVMRPLEVKPFLPMAGKACARCVEKNGQGPQTEEQPR